MTVSLIRGTTCGHCGRDDIGSYEAGYGAIGRTRLCHPNATGRPRCYDLVTRFNHPMPCDCHQRYPRAGDKTTAVWA